MPGWSLISCCPGSRLFQSESNLRIATNKLKGREAQTRPFGFLKIYRLL